MILSCPNRDGFLKTYTTTGKNGLPVTYHRCPHCRGTWASGFAVNFLADVVEHPRPPAVVHPPLLTPLCPECKAHLLSLRSDNVPASVTAYRCPAGHGYFFPTGELTKFKEAQQAKIAYHKLWNIPIPSISSVLLASVVIILFGSIIATTIAIRQQQTNVSQARQLLVSLSTLPTAAGTVFFVATTSVPATVSLYIPSWNTTEILMETTDRTTHTATVSTIPSGTFSYFFTITINGKTVQTEMFEFTAR